MANIVNPNLPADLPTDWTTSQYVSPNGSEVSLSQQHGYNYLMEQVNAAQTAVNTLAEQAQEAVSGLESGALTATATRSGTTVAITGPEDAVTVTFLAPADWTEGDSYTYNGTPITVTDLNGNPVTDGWKQGAVLTFQISGGVAYFVGGASGSFLLLSGGTMTGPAVGAPGGSTIPQFRNVYYGTEALTPGSSPLPEGTLYITPEMEYEGAGKRTCRFVVGTSTAGWTAADCDYLCDGTADDVEINAAIQALPSTGGEIVILDGTYNITATITMNKQNVVLKGNGPSTILQRNFSSSSFTNPVLYIYSKNNVICNLAVDGNSETYSSDGYGISIFADNGKVLSCYLFNNSGSAILASGLNDNNVISSIVATGNNIGINISNGNGHLAVGNICNNNGTGILLGGNSSAVVGNCCNGNSRNGIYLASCNNSACVGNTCNDNDEYGIYIQSASSCNNNIVSGNTAIRGTGTAEDYTGQQYTILATSNTNNNLFSGNNIMGKNYVDYGAGNTWANNKFE